MHSLFIRDEEVIKQLVALLRDRSKAGLHLVKVSLEPVDFVLDFLINSRLVVFASPVIATAVE